MQKRKKIKAIINNNFISVEENNIEMIFMGRGIAFGKKIGDDVDVTRIEKSFVLEDATQRKKFQDLTSQISAQVLTVTMKIVEEIEKEVTIKINTATFMALSDHIAFAMDRKKNGQNLPNKLLNEVKRFYPEEILLGKRAIEIIKDETGVYLSEDEAGFLAIHFINAMDKKSQTGLEQIKAVTDIVQIIQDYFEIKFDEESFYYQRLITHLKFFLSRVFKKDYVSESCTKDDFFYRVSKVQYPKIHKCVDLVVQYMDFNYCIRMKNEEKGYLVIHLCGLLNRKEN